MKTLPGLVLSLAVCLSTGAPAQTLPMRLGVLTDMSGQFTIPAAEAFRPLSESACPLVKK